MKEYCIPLREMDQEMGHGVMCGAQPSIQIISQPDKQCEETVQGRETPTTAHKQWCMQQGQTWK